MLKAIAIILLLAAMSFACSSASAPSDEDIKKFFIGTRDVTEVKVLSIAKKETKCFGPLDSTKGYYVKTSYNSKYYIGRVEKSKYYEQAYCFGFEDGKWHGTPILNSGSYSP